MQRFEQFIREQRLLRNVTPATVEWYRNSFRWLSSDSPSQPDLNEAVMNLRERGLKPTGCNCAARAINSYLHWLHAGADVKCGPMCKHPKVLKLKEPETVLPTFTVADVKRLVSWKAKTASHVRLHVLVLFLLDTGCRISEALCIRVAEIDFDNMLVTLDGKGRKQRVVPFSFELRRKLFAYCRDASRAPEELLFASRNRTALGRRVVLRDVKLLCRRLGFAPPRRTLHAFRHTFAVNYLRNGGSVFHLQKVLGHSSLEMTRRYANLMTEDLQAIHQRVSLLAR